MCFQNSMFGAACLRWWKASFKGKDYLLQNICSKHVKQNLLARQQMLCETKRCTRGQAFCYETIMFGLVTYKLDAAAMRVHSLFTSFTFCNIASVVLWYRKREYTVIPSSNVNITMISIQCKYQCLLHSFGHTNQLTIHCSIYLSFTDRDTCYD